MERKALITYAAAVIASLLILLLFYNINESKIISSLNKTLYSLGLDVVDSEVKKDAMEIKVTTGGEGKNPNDLLLARYMQKTVSTLKNNKEIRLILVNSDDDILYQTSTAKELNINNEIYSVDSKGYIGNSILKTKIKYELSKYGILCEKIKIAPYPQVYLSSPDVKAERTVNLEVITATEDTDSTVLYVKKVISNLNETGTLICQYNLHIVNSGGKTLYLGSYDFFNEDNIVIS